MRCLCALVFVTLGPAATCAQDGTLDVLDGETLYEGGWLFTVSSGVRREERLKDGDSTVSDPLHRRRTELTTTMAAHYGLRYDLQLSAILPHVYREEIRLDRSGPNRLSADGPGDFVGLVKWRCWRWDAPGEALNLAVLGGVEFPTGSDHQRDHGSRLDPELQPGSGSWDPLAGAAITYEPRRWRFNAMALYKLNTENRHGYEFGDESFAELALGNRFWLEPYPGPFMRVDVLLRYRNEARARLDGHRLSASGGDLVTVGANWAFRPRPTIDIQLAIELPLYERVNGVQLAEEVSATFALGLRF